MGMLDILGGVALILFGIRFLRKGLDRLFGGRLLVWLAKVAASTPKAFTAGMVSGVVTPSSTSISLLGAQLATDPRLRLGGVLAMVLGANVGMTVTVQAMAFRIQDYAALGIVIGVAGFLYTKKEIWRGIGQCLLALSFIFLAIGWIGNGADSLASGEGAHRFFAVMQESPWLMYLGTTVLAVALQSSTTVIGLGIGLITSNLIGAALLVPWIAGANTGVVVTTLLVGWRTIEGRRLGLAAILSKLGFALPLLLFPTWSQELFNMLPGDLAKQTASGHTLFNLIAGLCALPFLPLLTRLAAKLIPDRKPDATGRVESLLDPKVLDTPSLALARATRETLHMADKVRAQLDAFWRACHTGNVELTQRIRDDDDVVDRYNSDLIDYLSRIGGEMSLRDNRWQLALMNSSMELETIGDLLEKQLCDLVIKQHNEGVSLSEENWRELEGIYTHLLERFDHATGLIAHPNLKAAEILITGKRVFNEDCRQKQAAHYERLRTVEHDERVVISFILDYLSGFQSIHGHVTRLVYAIIDRDRPHDAEKEHTL